MARCETCNRDFESEEALASHNKDKHFGNSVQQIKSKSRKGLVIGIIVGIIIIAVLGFMFFGKSTTGNAVNGDIQKITLSLKNGNYYPNTITVKEGVPVEISLDNSIQGCYRSFNIPDFGISKNFASQSDVLDFTPTKKGTFGFRCSMGMGRGTIIVD